MLLRRWPWLILWSKIGDAGCASDLVLAFSSVGHDPDRAPSPEFIGSATAGGRIGLFIIDESRSWATASGFCEVLQEAVALIRARQEVRSMLALGQSMGGFSALAAAEALPLDAVLAFGPQAQTRFPGETRWDRWTAALPQRSAPLPEGPKITLFHGASDDLPQAQAFPQRAGLDHLLFPDQTHSSLVPHLKTRGCLAGLVESALAGDRRRLLRIAGSAGGIRRQEPR